MTKVPKEKEINPPEVHGHELSKGKSYNRNLPCEIGVDDSIVSNLNTRV